MSTTMDIGNKLVALCREGKNEEAHKTLYSKDIVRVEAFAPNGGNTESKGMDAVMAKGKWWADNHEVHSSSVEGPFPHGDRFIVRFTYDVTFKPMKQRMKMDEAALFTVKDGKIVREEFFYAGM